MIIKLIIAVIVLMNSSISIAANNTYPFLISTDSHLDSRSAGKNLMSLTFGLSPLEFENKKENTLLIGVHGGNSKGYEWVYPLKILNSESILTYFFRWDDSKCPQPSANIMMKEIKKIIKERPSIKKIILLGHSYGGLLSSWFAENWSSSLLIDIHTIASPLAGNKLINNLCDYKPPKTLKDNVTFIQWRTQKNLDNAFKDLEFDPQEINLQGSEVFELPDLYKQKRLGHNWSISFVADELKIKRKNNEN